MLLRIITSLLSLILVVETPAYAQNEDARAKLIATSVTLFVLAVAADRVDNGDKGTKKLTVVDMLGRFVEVCRQEFASGSRYEKSDTKIFVDEFSSNKRFPELRSIINEPSCVKSVSKVSVKGGSTWELFVGSSESACARTSELLECDRMLQKRSKK